MGTQHSESPAAPKKGVTPPKGRPTRARGDISYRKQVFGPTAQWIALTVLLVLVFLVLIILTDGGDFNPFNDQRTGSVLALASLVAPG